MPTWLTTSLGFALAQIRLVLCSQTLFSTRVLFVLFTPVEVKLTPLSNIKTPHIYSTPPLGLLKFNRRPVRFFILFYFAVLLLLLTHGIPHHLNSLKLY